MCHYNPILKETLFRTGPGSPLEFEYEISTLPSSLSMPNPMNMFGRMMLAYLKQKQWHKVIWHYEALWRSLSVIINEKTTGVDSTRNMNTQTIRHLMLAHLTQCLLESFQQSNLPDRLNFWLSVHEPETWCCEPETWCCEHQFNLRAWNMMLLFHCIPYVVLFSGNWIHPALSNSSAAAWPTGLWWLSPVSSFGLRAYTGNIYQVRTI